jgi:hypothetical protein
MDTFLIEIEHDPVAGSYMACYSNGANVMLAAGSYQDAVLEADMLDPAEYDCA